MTRRQSKTPLRAAMQKDSPLVQLVSDGMGAVKRAHKDFFDRGIRAVFADSLDLDEALRAGHERENRWDYLLGLSPSQQLVAVEPHSAKQDEVTTIIKKRQSARDQLKGHLREGARVSRWLWVASGKVHFVDTEKTRRLLDQHGIEFVGTQVSAKHLP